MDNSFHRQESDAQQKRDILASLRIFESIFPLIRRYVNWLAGLLKLTEEEQEDAGIYLSRLGSE
jgi:hypothetical protein